MLTDNIPDFSYNLLLISKELYYCEFFYAILKINVLHIIQKWHLILCTETDMVWKLILILFEGRKKIAMPIDLMHNSDSYKYWISYCSSKAIFRKEIFSYALPKILTNLSYFKTCIFIQIFLLLHRSIFIIYLFMYRNWRIKLSELDNLFYYNNTRNN